MDNQQDSAQSGTVEQPWPHVWMAAFLKALANQGTPSAAAEAVGVDRSWPYVIRKKYPEFAAAWDVAKQVYADCLEQEADRRGLQGVERPRTTAQGAPVYDPRCLPEKVPLIDVQYSDNLLALRLKALRPESYRPQPEHAPSGPPVHINVNLADPALQALVSAVRARAFASAPAEQLPEPGIKQPPAPPESDGAR
jgi:hypothetical protein